MRILITNDDGIKSPGLKALKDAFSDHDVWVVAPDKENSGMSHSITFQKPVRFNQLDEQVFSCDGSPADCVMYSFLGAVPVRPDVVVSGINLGPNLGTDLIYSGTAAAARQASLMGLPGIAVSVNSYKPPFHFDATAKFVADNLELLVSLWHQDHFININTPNSGEFTNGFSITHPARRTYQDTLLRFDAPRGGVYYFLDGGMIVSSEKGSDSEAVNLGRVSISPVYLHPVNWHEEDAYKEASFRV